MHFFLVSQGISPNTTALVPTSTPSVESARPTWRASCFIVQRSSSSLLWEGKVSSVCSRQTLCFHQTYTHLPTLTCLERSVLCEVPLVTGSGFLCSILTAPPTAELEPLTDGQVSQTDEVRHKKFSLNLYWKNCSCKHLAEQLMHSGGNIKPAASGSLGSPW